MPQYFLRQFLFRRFKNSLQDRLSIYTLVLGKVISTMADLTIDLTAELTEEQWFSSKENARAVLTRYHNARRKEFKVVKSDTSRLMVRCPSYL